jgi:hypothetical protein
VGVLAGAAVVATTATLVLRDDKPPPVEVTFEIVGAAAEPPSVFWRTPGEGMEESLTVPTLPWTKTVQVRTHEGPLYLYATVGDFREPDPAGGKSISCRIAVDGQVVEQSAPGPLARCWTTLQRVFKANG